MTGVMLQPNRDRQLAVRIKYIKPSNLRVGKPEPTASRTFEAHGMPTKYFRHVSEDPRNAPIGPIMELCRSVAEMPTVTVSIKTIFSDCTLGLSTERLMESMYIGRSGTINRPLGTTSKFSQRDSQRINLSQSRPSDEPESLQDIFEMAGLGQSLGQNCVNLTSINHTVRAYLCHRLAQVSVPVAATDRKRNDGTAACTSRTMPIADGRREKLTRKGISGKVLGGGWADRVEAEHEHAAFQSWRNVGRRRRRSGQPKLNLNSAESAVVSQTLTQISSQNGWKSELHTLIPQASTLFNLDVATPAIAITSRRRVHRHPTTSRKLGLVRLWVWVAIISSTVMFGRRSGHHIKDGSTRSAWNCTVANSDQWTVAVSSISTMRLVTSLYSKGLDLNYVKAPSESSLAYDKAPI
ncbi:hypothetical protein DFJ58DRAFT_912395 [Suillus subalutaceus]|uniref:uncharacterized protein n=1 Tax=Suillus subalutaceus TaxID=48586 RepID=UPI001B86B90C|nr:uncharacterized protein DFJ58DRAFT_912395 [Suillus subalutaceus]KAG1863175.1 hypothetical protein DFJ58DRAFT_912395 [Suillus subalutaceus]